MHTFKNTCAQGDVMFIRLPEGFIIPPSVTRVEPVNGKIEIAHSETGHNHVMEPAAATLYALPDTIMECLLVVDKPSILEHLRSFDTHEPILFEKGAYRVRRQREYIPEGFRRVED